MSINLHTLFLHDFGSKLPFFIHSQENGNIKRLLESKYFTKCFFLCIGGREELSDEEFFQGGIFFRGKIFWEDILKRGNFFGGGFSLGGNFLSGKIFRRGSFQG